MSKHTLPSGAILDVTPLPYEEAWGVTQSFLKIIEHLKIDIKGIDFSAFQALDVLSFAHPICSVLSSKEAMEAARTCFKRCTIDGRKIDGTSFESCDARTDFLFAAFYALKENIAPFFVGLRSLFTVR